MIFVALFALGFLIGTIGTLIGVGGAFILLPVLILMYPDVPPEALTSVSLAAVAANALSGTVAYARMKRIEYKTAVWFALATIPGAVAGSYTTTYVPRTTFEMVLGGAMIATAVVLFFRRVPEEQGGQHLSGDTLVVSGRMRGIGAFFSLGVGYVSSLLGIGGGIIHVPVMIRALRFPVHLATATSHFVLAVMATVAVATHIVTGSYTHDVTSILMLCAGTIVGAQLGARLSTRVHADWIVRILAVAMVGFGIRLIVGTLG